MGVGDHGVACRSLGIDIGGKRKLLANTRHSVGVYDTAIEQARRVLTARSISYGKLRQGTVPCLVWKWGRASSVEVQAIGQVTVLYNLGLRIGTG